MRVKNVCSQPGCDRYCHGNGLCQTHYVRLKRFGNLDGHLGEPIKPGRKPKGDGHISHYGYKILVIDGRKIAEHRWVMEQRLGRRLLSTESVHHLNGDRLDNRPENLELWSRSQPSGQRVADKIQWAKEFLAQYGEAL